MERAPDCRKPPSGLFNRFLQSAARIICPPMGDKFHTCSLRSVFCQVQKVNCPVGAREATLGCALAENILTLFAANGGKLCELLTRWDAFFETRPDCYRSGNSLTTSVGPSR